jgi:glycerol-3-phosphate dehydrogenase
LRYLEHFEVALVRQSLRERQTLLSIAPHLVKPLTFLIPIYESGSRRPAQIRIGLLAYSALSGRRKLERHQMLNRNEVLEREPGLNPQGLKAGAVYYDAQAEFPERLAVENALSAAENGAYVLSYARATRLVADATSVVGVEFADDLNKTTHTVKANVTVNATGPWADATLNGLVPSSERLIGGTKGSHLVVEPFPGAPNEALYVEAADSRPYFIVPWRGRYLIGTTDLDYTDGDLDQVRASEEEINYLITSTNQVLGGARLTRDQLLSTYAGVRPLPYTNQQEESAITRAHIVKDHSPDIDGLISIVGGKITTCRSLAEDTVDLAFKKLGRESPQCRTEKLPLPGGELQSLEETKSQLVSTYSLDSQIADRLVCLYGARATAVLDVSRMSPELARPIDASGVLGAEIVYALEKELAQTLADVLMRRTMVGIEPRLRSGTAIAAAVIAAKYLDWSADRAAAEVEQFAAELADLAPADQRAQSTAVTRV